MIIQNFDLNLIPDSAPVVVHCDQYDRGTGRLVISLYEGSIAYSPSGTAVIQGVKPDGKGFDYNCTLSGNTVTADLTEQMTAVAGQVRTQIVVTESTGRTGTFVFILDVQRSALPADTDMSESDYQMIEQAIEAAQEAVEDSSAWAIGERGGIPVSPTDETYNNNAKYWAEQAAQYAQGGIIFKGSVAFASIPTTGMADGDMYNITNDFTTDSRFIEGAGKECAAGTNIVWIEDVEKWDIFAMSKIGSLDDLNDVTLSSPTNGQVLKYNSTTQKWENANESGGGGGDYIGLYGDTLVGSDLNNITSVGNYYNDGTVTVSHYPSNAIITATSSFRLTVEKMGDSASTNLRQTYVLDNSVDFVYERHRTNGSWSSWQKVLTSYSNIGELDNVSISSPANNQILTYNSTTQKWENANAQGGSGDYVGLYGMTEIQSSDGQGSTAVDLNDYTTVGNYYCNGKALIQFRYYQFVGNPTGYQVYGRPSAVFLLYVRKISDTCIVQTLYVNNNGKLVTFEREGIYNGATWSFYYWALPIKTGSNYSKALKLTQDAFADILITTRHENDILVFNNSAGTWENKPVLNDLYKANGILGAKNLLPNKATSQTINGVTFTVNSDGSITANGTATAECNYFIKANTSTSGYLLSVENNIPYRLTGRPTTGITGTCTLYIGQYINNAWQLKTDSGAGVEVTFDATRTSDNCVIYCPSGTIFNNAVFKPMLRLATDTDDTYVPYAMTNRELTEKGRLKEIPLTNKSSSVTWNRSYCYQQGDMLFFNVFIIVSGTFNGVICNIDTLRHSLTYVDLAAVSTSGNVCLAYYTDSDKSITLSAPTGGNIEINACIPLID